MNRPMSVPALLLYSLIVAAIILAILAVRAEPASAKGGDARDLSPSSLWVTGGLRSPAARECVEHPGLCDERRVARRIDRELRRYGSPMAGLGKTFAHMARRHGTNPYAVLAISVVESGLGRQACGYNSFGLGSCGRAWSTVTKCGTTWRLSSLTSWTVAFDFQMRFLRCFWPSATTVYHLHGYCECGWYSKVDGVMRSLGSPTSGMRWRDAVR